MDILLVVLPASVAYPLDIDAYPGIFVDTDGCPLILRGSAILGHDAWYMLRIAGSRVTHLPRNYPSKCARSRDHVGILFMERSAFVSRALL